MKGIKMGIEKLDEKEIKLFQGITLLNKIYLSLVVFLFIFTFGIVLVYIWGINFINLHIEETPEISSEKFRGLIHCIFILIILILFNNVVSLFSNIRSNKKFKGIIDKLLQ